ncbi:autotransporter domain-containing protein [Anaerovibrio lipolyticus]|uniref:autotransporter domain-containing protein n=1 Tax=Anaerovibrio lipolyticus TaxID=82374 RepID=UPI0004823538|nr:autotransporter domain-containing protein [Anaerovibrio lipolyticus]
MTTRKYEYPLGGDISLNKANQGRGWKGLKGHMALALAVSLWIAGSGMASAEVVITSEPAGATADLEKATSPVTIYYLKNDTSLKISGDDNTEFNSYYAAKFSNAADITLSGYTLTVDGGNFKNKDLHAAYAEGMNGQANGNKLFINNGTNIQAIFGGAANAGASNNEVNISGGEVVSAYGGSTVSGNANNNTVTFTSGEVMKIYGGDTNDGAANGNTVNISGGTVYRVYGGKSLDGSAADNTVNILKSGMTFRGIYGGYAPTSSGNTINFAAKNITVEEIGDVQNLNFYMPADIVAGDTMVTVTDQKTSLNGVTVGAAALTGVQLSQGDSVTLLKNEKGFEGTAVTTKLTTPPKATSLTVDTSYEFNIRQNSTDITATLGDVVENNASERAKSLVETRAAATTFVNAGADMLASQGFQQAANAVAVEKAANGTGIGAKAAGGFTPFAAFGGSSLRAESGSHVDTKGFGLNLGFAREINNSQGKLLFGPIVEYGGGGYDSYLDDGTHGEGGAHYYGVGIMARQVNNDGFYYEGSLRGGRVDSDYKSDINGVGHVNYDSYSNYLAAHIGLGKVFDIGHNNTVDGYFKYFYSHQGGDTTTIHIAGMNNETGDFDAVDSNRIRIGARFTHKINDKNSYYGGIAYQYEFGSEARAHFNGNSVPSPSMKGSSGLLELGWQVKPGDGPLTLDFGLNGWIGKQRGGSVQLGATWNF